MNDFVLFEKMETLANDPAKIAQLNSQEKIRIHGWGFDMVTTPDLALELANSFLSDNVYRLEFINDYFNEFGTVKAVVRKVLFVTYEYSEFFDLEEIETWAEVDCGDGSGDNIAAAICEYHKINSLAAQVPDAATIMIRSWVAEINKTYKASFVVKQDDYVAFARKVRKSPLWEKQWAKTKARWE